MTSFERKRLLAAYERRMSQEITHPIFEYRISYRRVLGSKRVFSDDISSERSTSTRPSARGDHVEERVPGLLRHRRRPPPHLGLRALPRLPRERLQYSVFRCHLDRSERLKMEAALRPMIHHEQDQILFVDLGPVEGRARVCVSYLGKRYTPPDDGPVIL